MGRLVVKDSETYHIKGWYDEDEDIALCGRIIESDGYDDECKTCEKIFLKRDLEKFFSEGSDVAEVFCLKCGSEKSHHSKLYFVCPTNEKKEVKDESKDCIYCNDGLMFADFDEDYNEIYYCTNLDCPKKGIPYQITVKKEAS